MGGNIHLGPMETLGGVTRQTILELLLLITVRIEVTTAATGIGDGEEHTGRPGHRAVR